MPQSASTLRRSTTRLWLDATATTLEDNTVNINLVAVDADSISAELVFSIQTQPVHGSLVRNVDGSYSYTHLGPYLQCMLARPSVQRVLASEQLVPPFV